jgi:hypothetical protein
MFQKVDTNSRSKASVKTYSWEICERKFQSNIGPYPRVLGQKKTSVLMKAFINLFQVKASRRCSCWRPRWRLLFDLATTSPRPTKLSQSALELRYSVQQSLIDKADSQHPQKTQEEHELPNRLALAILFSNRDQPASELILRIAVAVLGPCRWARDSDPKQSLRLLRRETQQKVKLSGLMRLRFVCTKESQSDRITPRCPKSRKSNLKGKKRIYLQ